MRRGQRFHENENLENMLFALNLLSRNRYWHFVYRNGYRSYKCRTQEEHVLHAVVKHFIRLGASCLLKREESGDRQWSWSRQLNLGLGFGNTSGRVGFLYLYVSL